MGTAAEIKGTKDNDTLDNKDKNGFLEITGYGGDDIITGGNGTSIIYGDGKFPLGRESLSGKEAKDYKDAYGNDVINGGTGVNIIHGGLGDDEITGGAGINIIQFKAGDGNDVILNSKGEDYLYFCDLGFDDAVFSKEGNNLVIAFKNNESMKIDPDMGSVTLKDYLLYGENFSVKGIGFNATNPAKPTKYGVDTEPVVSMLAYDNNLTVEKLTEKIKRAFSNSAEIYEVFGGIKNEIKMDTPRKITAGNSGNNIKGSDGDDTILSGRGDDIIKGGGGDDKLYGGRGKNTFIFSDGDGKDTIYYQNGEDIIDISKATVIEGRTEFICLKEKNDLIIKYGNGARSGESTDEIRLINYFRSNGKYDIKLKFIENNIKTVKNIKDFACIEIDFSGETRGKTLSGTFLDDNIKGSSGDDLIRGGDGDDIIEGGAGNDRLYGDGGNNTFVFNTEDGQDTIYSGRGTDTIKFADIEEFNPKTMYFSAKGSDLIICYDKENSITISKYLANPAKSSVRYIQFMENDTVLISDLIKEHSLEFYGTLNKRNSIKSTDKKDVITGGNLNDTIAALGGDDIISAGEGDDIVWGGNGDDIIYGEGGDDRLYGDDGNDTIYGNNGDDIIYGGNGDDIIYGGLGNDKLYGDAGFNTFHFKKEDGNDIVYSGRGEDTLCFDDVNFSDLKWSLSGSNGLAINYGDGSSVDIASYFSKKGNVSTKKIATKDGEKTLDEITNSRDFKVLINGAQNKRNTLKGTYKNDILTGKSLSDTIFGNDGDDIIYGEGGDDIIYGGNGDDIIYGGLGNDRLYGDTGNNTFYFNEGDGTDTIYMNSKASDTMVFDKKLKDALTFDRAGNNLIVKYGSKGDSVTILNYLNSKNPSIKNIVFANYDNPKGDFSKEEGLLLSDIVVKKQDVKFELANGKTVSGEYYEGYECNNLIISTGTYSRVNAGGGDDIIYLQSKNAAVYGGTGDDKYIVSSLKNNTYIEDNEGSNTVKIIDKKQNVKVLFDVKIQDGKIVNSDENFDSMLIINNTVFNKIKSGGKLNAISGIEIADFSKDISNEKQNIKKIETNNGYLEVVQLNSLRQEVANWLSGTGGKYESAVDVLAGGNKTDIKELLAVYQSVENKWV